MAESPGQCLHEPCTCEAPNGGGYCSDSCRQDAAVGNHGCSCGHDDCTAPEPGPQPTT